MPTIEEQLATLERRLRRQQLATGSAVLLAVVAIGVSAASRTAGELRARAFHLVNGDGTTVAQLAFTPGGGPFLNLDDKGRKAVLSVGGDRSPTLLMLGNPGLLAASSKYVWLKDPSGKTVFSTAPGGGPPADKVE